MLPHMLPTYDEATQFFDELATLWKRLRAATMRDAPLVTRNV